MSLIAKSFIAGSSLPAAILTLGYVGRAYKKTPAAARPFAFADASVGIPLVYGAWNVLAVGYIKKYKVKNVQATMFVFGVFCGLTFASMGTALGANAMFDLKWGQFPLAAALYGLIFSTLVLYVDETMGLL